MVLVGVGLLPCNVASMISLKPRLVMWRANKSWEVPTLSSVKDWMRDIWTPKSLWIPEHSMQMMIPKFVDNQVASKIICRINCNILHCYCHVNISLLNKNKMLVKLKHWRKTHNSWSYHFESYSHNNDHSPVFSVHNEWLLVAIPVG